MTECGAEAVKDSLARLPSETEAVINRSCKFIIYHFAVIHIHYKPIQTFQHFVFLHGVLFVLNHTVKKSWTELVKYSQDWSKNSGRPWHAYMKSQPICGPFGHNFDGFCANNTTKTKIV